MADTGNTPTGNKSPAPVKQGGAPVAGGGPDYGAMGGQVGSALRGLFRGDIALALGVVAVLVVLILPMPSWLLDASLALSMAFSVMILMTVLFIQKPLEFSSFPTVLLIATMLRLSLNLASTRLILGEGHTGTDAAGKVIEAFGGFLTSGNFVIGIIVFTILVIVNFVVITKGSGRIAEVAARFSLDAMPGKQMAIDADLSAGMITEDEAKTRRRELEQESTFFGSMDGAAKFVRGDAIAGILITFINIIGGIIIGVAQKDMSMADAAATYTVLTVGDGLVSQIPALIVSVGAGLLVSKAGVAGSTDKALFGQLSFYPSAMGLSSFLMVSLALLPGIPAIPFLLLAGVTGGMAFITKRNQMQKAKDEKTAADIKKAPVAEEPISKALELDNIRLELGYGLLPLVNSPKGAKLTDQVKGLRKQLAEEMGFVMPSVRIQDNLQLASNAYVILIKEIVAAKGEVRPNKLLCLDPTGNPISLPGEKTTEPAFGLPAMWIDEKSREEAQFKGLTIVDPSTVITTHLTEIIKDNMTDLLSYTETQKLLDELPQIHQKMVSDIIPSQINVGTLQRILQNLVSERVSVRDLPTILEGVAEAAAYTKNVSLMTEHVRMRLSRQICEQHRNGLGMIPIVTLSPEWEQNFAEALVGSGEDRQLSMPPTQLQDFIRKVKAEFDKIMAKGEAPVLLTSPTIRPYVRSIIERFRPQTPVLSQNEIHSRAKIQTLGQI